MEGWKKFNTMTIRENKDKKIEALEKRVQDLVGMNDELEMMISQYEREEIVFKETPKHLQLDETF